MPVGPFFCDKNSLYVFSGRASNVGFLFLLTLILVRQLDPTLSEIFSFYSLWTFYYEIYSPRQIKRWPVSENW